MDGGNVFEGHVVPSVGIDNMVNQRGEVVRLVEQALTLLVRARDLANAAHVGFPRFKLDDSRYGLTSMIDGAEIDDTMEAIRSEIDVGAWAYLMRESGLLSFMDAEARKEWDAALHGKGEEVPAMTAETVAATFRQLYAARGEMFDRGVINCFRNLSWCYKSNNPFRFGKRIVVRSLNGWHSFEKQNELDDLMRVLSVLDGKPEPDVRGGINHLLHSKGMTASGKAGTVENDYLHIRTFKNHNGHVTFKRLDLVEKMNAIIARHYPGALPAPRAA